jgi:hypothetical protein
MATSIANGATVETKAVFVKSFSGGNTTYRRLPFNIEVRTYPNETIGQYKRQTFFALVLGGGQNPDRANIWDTQQGEVYDAVEYHDVYPYTWPRIGETAD